MKNSSEIESIINTLRKEHYEANHVCNAWVIGEESEIFKANDDGEPGHSAGDPILGQIRSRELTFTLVAVVRYFGGTKLGVGGLIHAYKTAANEALKQAEIIKIYPKDTVSIQYGYQSTNAFKKLQNDYNLEIVEENFTEICKCNFKIKINSTFRLKDDVSRMSEMGEEIKIVDIDFYKK